MATCIDTRQYPSTRRGSTTKYSTRKYNDETYSCNCPGWRFVQPGQPRGCSHCEWFRNDYWLVTIGEASRDAVAGKKWTKITEYPSGLWLIKRWDAKTTVQQMVDAADEAKRREREALTRKSQAAQRLRELKRRRAQFNNIIGNPSALPAPRSVNPIPNGRPIPILPPVPVPLYSKQPLTDRARIAWDEEV